MRTLIKLLLFGVLGTAGISGQAIEREFVWGRDYTFERMEAKRVVNDKEDKGTLRLVAYVYRPVKNDRKEVVLFSHGSTGGLARSPKEPLDGLPQPVIHFFVSRGYTLVVPMRRGRGESSGTYIEECSVYTGECTMEAQVPLGERAVREALLDTSAVIDQLILGRLAPRDSQILAVGVSRGGFLSLLLAGERPKLVKGIINFVGGWYAVNDRVAPEETQKRMADQKARLQRAAKNGPPSIWFYAARDPFYKEGVPQELHRYWTEAGGKADFVYIDNHTLPSGHVLASNLSLWGKQADAFLKTIETGKP